MSSRAFVNISHKCHFAWCLNVAHLEQVVKEVNDDRTRCKVGSRANDGEAFDELDAGESPVERPELEGPCTNGCTTSGQWKRDPDDKTKVLCNACYQKKHYLRKQEAQSPNGTRPKNQGPCVNGCTETPQWLKDPDDKTKVLCNACYHRKYVSRRKRIHRLPARFTGPLRERMHE
ncbi:hypothetical protein BDR22DRAFT_816982 [Usnea florida]